MGYDRNDCWMTCGERDDKIAEYRLGPYGDPWSEIGRLREALRINALRWGFSDAEIDAILYPPKD